MLRAMFVTDEGAVYDGCLRGEESEAPYLEMRGRRSGVTYRLHPAALVPRGSGRGVAVRGAARSHLSEAIRCEVDFGNGDGPVRGWVQI